jgi:hypothetical protein
MQEKEKDPNLSAPQEANTTKHINFVESEEATSDRSNEDKQDDSNSPTKKAWEELRKEDKK